MSRLIDADALIETIIQHGKDIKSDVPMIEDIYQTAHKHIIELVKIQPTAYDVEKVVAELEEERKEVHRGMDKFGPTTDLVCMDGAFAQAIEIVRKGGVEHE